MSKGQFHVVETQGAAQFLTAKKQMLDAYDRARTQAKSHEAEVYHGKVAEAQTRHWLSQFLPKRYGVTAGYIVLPGEAATVKLPHYDVIIYDTLESPVLWIEQETPSTGDPSRALLAEHVRGVFEVKSALNSETARAAIEHLGDLSDLLAGIDHPKERYKKFLPPSFFCAAIFFELRKCDEFSQAALDNLVPTTDIRGYYGGVVLRGDGMPEHQSGYLNIMTSGTPNEGSVGKSKQSLLDGMTESNSKSVAPDAHLSSVLMWSVSAFAMFAFDVVAMLNGTFEPGRASSFFGMSYLRGAT